MPVFDLVIAKGGPKLKRSLSQDAAALAEMRLPSRPKVGEDGYPILPPGLSATTMVQVPGGGIRARLQGFQYTLEKLSASLTNQLGRPVINKTGLEGLYDISIFWELDQSEGTGGSLPAPSDPALLHGPSLETAVQEQLGLRLVSSRDDVKLFNIDHVDRVPTDN